jgi:FkbM family methyltransferase
MYIYPCIDIHTYVYTYIYVCVYTGLCLYTHHTTAPEETAFLYNEIFEQKIYFKNGIILKENDLVIDVGSNVGFFSVFAELEFLSSNALRIIAVEPMIENFNLLKKNLARYVPSAFVVQAAVGCVHSEGIMSDDNRNNNANRTKGDLREKDTDSKNEMHMTYFPYMPGNSCATIFVADKFNQHKRANFLTGMKEEICTLQSLSSIIDESGFKVNDSQRISLLKVVLASIYILTDKVTSYM